MEQSLVNMIVIIAGSIIILSAIYALWKKIEKRFLPAPSQGSEYVEISLWKLALDHIPSAIVIADDSGKIVYANKAITALLGWRVNEITGSHLLKIMPEEMKDLVDVALRRGIQNKTESLGKPVEMWCMSKWKEKLPFEFLIDKMDHDDHLFFIIKIKDIRRQVAEKEHLQKLVEFFTKSEALIGMGSFRWDFINDKVLMSPGMLQLFDLDEDDNNCPAQITTNRLDPKDREKVANTILEAVNSKRGYEMEFHLKNGKLIRTVAELEFNADNKVTVINGAMRELKDKSND